MPIQARQTGESFAIYGPMPHRRVRFVGVRRHQRRRHGTNPAGKELSRDQWGYPGRSPYRGGVRPVTSIAIAVVLAFIVIAFVVKLLTGGLTP